MLVLTYCYDGKQQPKSAGEYSCIMVDMQGNYSLSVALWEYDVTEGKFGWFVADAGGEATQAYPYAFMELTAPLTKQVVEELTTKGKVSF
jgi:hypothetical protein